MERFAIYAMTTLYPLIAEAQPLAPVGSLALSRPAVVSNARVVELPMTQSRAEQPDGRRRRALRAALWSTAVGFGLGAIAGSQIETGCDTSPSGGCGERHDKLTMVLAFGGIGSVLEAGAGGVGRDADAVGGTRPSARHKND